MKRKWTLQALLAWMIGLLWICCGSIPAAASQNENVGREKIRVVINDYPLYFQLHQDGNVTGYVQEYLRDIAEYTGWEYEYVELNLAEAIRALENGTVDILPGNQYTPERAQIMDFSREPMGQGETVLCVLPHDRKYAFNDFAGYGGMRIAALKGSVRIGQMQEKLRQYGTSAVFLEYDSDMASKEALLRGEVDAVLMSSIRCEEGYKIVARVSTAPLYFALNKNKPFLKQKIDAAIEEIHLKRPYYEAELNEKYYGGIKEQLSLSDEEKEYVKSAGVITVAVSDGMKPVEYYDKSLGEYRGIIIDSLNYISEYTGLQFRFVEKQGRSMLREQLKDGTVKIVGSVVGDETIAAELGVNLTEPYYSMEVATIINQKIEEDHAKDLCVAVKEDSIFPEKMARSLGYTNISYYPTLEDCLRAVNRGAQDVTFVPSYSRDRLLKHSYYKNLVSYNIAGETYDFCVGISEGADKLLYSIINKAVRSISEKTKNEIVVANITQNNDKDTWHDFFRITCRRF